MREDRVEKYFAARPTSSPTTTGQGHQRADLLTGKQKADEGRRRQAVEALHGAAASSAPRRAQLKKTVTPTTSSQLLSADAGLRARPAAPSW